MKVLVTGNLGYIGSILTQELHQRNHEVIGLDIGYFQDCLLTQPHTVSHQHMLDIRDIEKSAFTGIDAVIHLAALSNDPLGEFSPKLTEEINRDGAIRAAELAKKSGVSRFVYASSQSMYGVASTDQELDEDHSDKNPITAYARTKWEAEQEINSLRDQNFCVSAFRPSTVFGASPRFRSDIVFNSLLGSAYTTGKIEIKSDGTPWRPVIHVRDVSKAFMAGIEAPANMVNGEAFNVGIPDGNFTVRDLALAAQNAIPSSSLVFTGEHGSDSRTYRVAFAKILGTLKDHFRPSFDLKNGGQELVAFFDECRFSKGVFNGAMTNRLKKLQELVASEVVDGTTLRLATKYVPKTGVVRSRITPTKPAPQ